MHNDRLEEQVRQERMETERRFEERRARQLELDALKQSFMAEISQMSCSTVNYTTGSPNKDWENKCKFKCDSHFSKSQVPVQLWQVWYEIFSLPRATLWPPAPGENVVRWWQAARCRTPKALRKGFDSVTLLISWMLWKQRNECMFEHSRPSVSSLLARNKDELKLWDVH